MSASGLRVGVLGIQGGFAEHLSLLSKFGNSVEAVDVRDPAALASVDALVIPGGESTVIRLVATRRGMLSPLRDFVASGKPVWGVCAGMVCLAESTLQDSAAVASSMPSKAEGVEEKSSLTAGLIGGLHGVSVSRNFFGNQSQSSFRTMQLTEAAAKAGLSRASHFIRAPAVTDVSTDATVETLATVVANDGRKVAVALRCNAVLATAFHPEVSRDATWTSFFLNVVCADAVEHWNGGAQLTQALAVDAGPHFIPDEAAVRAAIEGTSPAPETETGIRVGKGAVYGTTSVKRAMPRFLQGGVIMDVVNAEQARIAEAAGACAVMALERIPADIKKDGGIARMSDPLLIREVQEAVSIPVMAKARIGHFAEARVIQALDVDCIDESEVLTPADELYHIRKEQFTIPFVCGAKNLGEALRRIAEGAAMIRLKGNAGTGNVMHAVRHARAVFAEIRQLASMNEDEVYDFAKAHGSPLSLVKLTRRLGRLPVVTFAAGGLATPADVMLMMEMGCDGVFVGSGIFKGENSPLRARAMVDACTYYRSPLVVAQVSEGLGKAMVGVLDNGETYNYVADSVL